MSKPLWRVIVRHGKSYEQLSARTRESASACVEDYRQLHGEKNVKVIQPPVVGYALTKARLSGLD